MADLTPVHTWRIHLGVHKTGTTYLQGQLAKRRSALAAAAVDVLLPDQIRALEHRVPQVRGRVHRRFPGILSRSSDFTAALEQARTGASTVVVSEENLLALPGHIIRGSFYDRARPHVLPSIGRLAKRTETTLLVAVRSMDTFLPSLYAQALRHRPPPDGGFEHVLDHFVRPGPPSWVGLVRRIRRCAPSARLVLWKFEDMSGNEAAILKEICGMDVSLSDTAVPSVTQSGTTDAIEAAERLDPGLSRTERERRVDSIYRATRASGPIFQPLSDHDRAALQDAYRADIDLIDHILPSARLRFAATP